MEKKYLRTKRTLSILLLALIIIIIMLLLRRCGTKTLTPEYQLPPEDENAVQIEGEDPKDRPGPVEHGGSVTLVYSDQITVTNAEGTVSLYYQNPVESDHNVVLEVIAESGGERYAIAKSGLLEPGYMVSEIDLARDSGVTLAPGGYKGVIKLHFYDPDTGEKAMVDTEIPMDIAVR